MVEPREQFFQDLLSAVDQQMNTVKNDIKDIMKEKTSFIVSFENFVERYDTMEKNIQDLQNKYEEMAANLMTVMTDTKIQLGAIIAQLEILMINGTPLPAKRQRLRRLCPYLHQTRIMIKRVLPPQAKQVKHLKKIPRMRCSSRVANGHPRKLFEKSF